VLTPIVAQSSAWACFVRQLVLAGLRRHVLSAIGAPICWAPLFASDGDKR